MKTKRFNKKLSLKRETVANLSNDAMKKVVGGSLPGSQCPSFCGIKTCLPFSCPCPIESVEDC